MHFSFTLILALLASMTLSSFAQQPVPERPRILISTDIGGTDPDDNQSMMHFLLYCNEFECEGLVSSPSFGTGDKSEILRRNRQTLWGGCTDANPKLLLNDT